MCLHNISHTLLSLYNLHLRSSHCICAGADVIRCLEAWGARIRHPVLSSPDKCSVSIRLCVFINVPQWSCGLQHECSMQHMQGTLVCVCSTAADCSPMSRSVTNGTDIYSSPKCILIIAAGLWLVSHPAYWLLIGRQGPLTILNQLSTSHRQVWKYSLSRLSDWGEA